MTLKEGGDKVEELNKPVEVQLKLQDCQKQKNNIKIVNRNQ